MSYRGGRTNGFYMLTEQAALALNEETHEALQSLRGMGFLLAIDDFFNGANLASLS